MKKELENILDSKMFCDICGECHKALKNNIKSPVIVGKQIDYIG